MDSTAITNFNMQFVNAGAKVGTTLLKGAKVLALQQKVLASNAVNKVHKIVGSITTETINTSKDYNVITSINSTTGYIENISVN